MKEGVMNKISIIIAVVSIAASEVSPVQAQPLPHGLYGWTRNRDGNGNIDFVRINEMNGQASFLFSMAIPSGYEARDLTYDPRDGGRFYGNLRGGTVDLFAEISPGAQTMTTHTYSGFPLSFFQGVEYLKGKGIVLSGADAAGANSLYVVDPSGAMQEAALEPLIEDQDHLGANAIGGDLHVFDWNHPTNGYSINKWTDPFGTPALTGVYNGTILGDQVERAIDPFGPLGGTFYSGDLSMLVRFDMASQQAVVVGNYNYSDQIWGIAWTPEPSSLSLLLVGGLSLLRRRRAVRGSRAAN